MGFTPARVGIFVASRFAIWPEVCLVENWMFLTLLSCFLRLLAASEQTFLWQMCFCLHYLATFVAWLRPVCLLQIDWVEQKGGLQTRSISFWANLGFSDFLYWLDEETGDVWFNVNWLLNLGVYFDYFDGVFC